LDARSVKPNFAHYYLASLESEGKLRAVVTQNIDGPHNRAGSKTVYEIHGTTERNYCSRCRRPYPADYIFNSKEPIPRCSCGGTVRCDVTLYGESLPEEAVDGAVRAIGAADVLIIGGTSLTVYPAASYVRYFRGSHLVIINRDRLDYPLRPERDLFVQGSIGAVFAAVDGSRADV
ncbi:MAG: NAD-dependent protein deacylase, partial [Clostridia bacterium]|nr:NAD-dependent protein deacylase [Clostridia bacterium]